MDDWRGTRAGRWPWTAWTVLTVLLAGGVAHEVRAEVWDWAWGELIYGRTYTTTLKVSNKCDTEQTVLARIENATSTDGKHRRTPDGWTTVEPDARPRLAAQTLLTIPAATCAPPASPGPTRCELVVQPGDTDLEVVITTPPPPDLRTLGLPAGSDPHEWYEETDGVLHLTGTGQYVCLGEPSEYFISGHVHIDPNPPALDAFARPTCRQWWETGARPAGLTEDCTDEFRRLARLYRQEVLEPLAASAPAEWAWLPSSADIQNMALGELLAMKVRADAQRGRMP